MSMNISIPKSIRSFVLRQGRLTAAQQWAVEKGLPQFGLPAPQEGQPYQWSTLFGNEKPVIIDIGFGMGQGLYEEAKMNPHRNFVGIEVHLPGVGALLHQLLQSPLDNLKVLRFDAVDVLTHAISPGTVHKVQLICPDPWHKKKHHKRRIIQPAFLQLIDKALLKEGFFYVVTDWAPYAEHIQLCVKQSTSWSPVEEHQAEKVIFDSKFQRRAREEHRAIQSCLYQKN